MIEIVAAGAERLDELEPLWWALVEHQVPLLPQLGAGRDREDTWRRRRAHYEELIAKPGAFLLLAERDGRPVGYAMVERSMPSQTWQLDEMATLETLVILPEARAAGTGNALVERAREKLRAAGVKHWGVGVVATNEGGERFYRRHGFEPVFTELIARL